MATIFQARFVIHAAIQLDCEIRVPQTRMRIFKFY
jgi:hypothetical protein